MTKILTFSYNTPIADDKNVRFAVSRQSFQGGRAFVVQTSKSLAKERKVFNTNLKTNVDALNEVEQVRVKSLSDLSKFKEVVNLVNTKVTRHNNSKLKTFLKFLLIPWAIATIFKSNFFKTFDSVEKKHEFTIDFSPENPSEFGEAMKKLQENKENITELDFSQFVLSPANLQELEKALKKNSTVRSLIFSQPPGGLQLTGENMQLVCSVLNACHHIDSLSFAGQQISEENMEILGKALATKRIKHLDLSHTSLSENAVQTLKNALTENTELRSLNLSSNVLGMQGATVLADILKSNPKLTSLYIGKTALSSNQIQPLADAIKDHPALEIVDIRENALQDAGSLPFANALRENNHIKRFDISSNELGVEAAKAFGKAIQNHPSLEHISLYNNKITKTGIEAIAAAIKQNNRSLHYIDLAENDVDRKTYTYRLLKNALAKNPTRRYIRFTTAEKAPPPKAAKPSKLERAAPYIETAATFVIPIIPQGAITGAVRYVSPHLSAEPEDFWETDPGVLRKK